MTKIKCEYEACLYRNNGYCNKDQVLVDHSGECVDLTVVTDYEYKQITGRDRMESQ